MRLYMFYTLEHKRGLAELRIHKERAGKAMGTKREVAKLRIHKKNTGKAMSIKKETRTIAVQVSQCKVAAFYSPAFAVPSTLQGLTSLFGMVRGGALVL